MTKIPASLIEVEIDNGNGEWRKFAVDIDAFQKAANQVGVEAETAARGLQDLSASFALTWHNTDRLLKLFGIDLLEPYRRRAARRAQLALAVATIGATIAIAILAS